MENSLLEFLNMDWIKKRTYCKSCSGKRTRGKHAFPPLTSEVTFSASPIDSLSKSKIKINSIFKYRDSSHLQFPYKSTYDFIWQLFSTITLLLVYKLYNAVLGLILLDFLAWDIHCGSAAEMNFTLEAAIEGSRMFSQKTSTPRTVLSYIFT